MHRKSSKATINRWPRLQPQLCAWANYSNHIYTIIPSANLKGSPHLNVTGTETMAIKNGLSGLPDPLLQKQTTRTTPHPHPTNRHTINLTHLAALHQTEPLTLVSTTPKHSTEPLFKEYCRWAPTCYSWLLFPFLFSCTTKHFTLWISHCAFHVSEPDI